jgi:hypothetical protein
MSLQTYRTPTFLAGSFGKNFILTEIGILTDLGVTIMRLPQTIKPGGGGIYLRYCLNLLKVIRVEFVGI